jgi:hypothetical protein
MTINWGVYLESSSNNRFFYNNFEVNTQQVISDGSPNTWDNGYPSGGNYWSNYQTTYPSAEENDSSAFWNTPYMIDTNNTDMYPLMGPFNTFSVGTWNGVECGVDTVSNSTTTNLTFSSNAKTLTFSVTGPNGTVGFCRVAIPTGLMWVSTLSQWSVIVGGTFYGNQTIIQSGNYTYIYFTYTQGTKTIQIRSPYVLVLHKMAITSVAPSKTIVGHGYGLNASVIVTNQGDYTETCNVTLYGNATAIATQLVTLASGTSTIINFTWSTAGFALGHYTISANITLALGETNSWTGPLTYGTVKVTIPGDINGDGKVNLEDLSIITGNWLRTVPPVPANADILNVGIINLRNLSVVTGHWLMHT